MLELLENFTSVESLLRDMSDLGDRRLFEQCEYEIKNKVDENPLEFCDSKDDIIAKVRDYWRRVNMRDYRQRVNTKDYDKGYYILHRDEKKVKNLKYYHVHVKNDENKMDHRREYLRRKNTCLLCSKVFLASHLKRHVDAVHRKIKDPKTSERKPCPDCGIEFAKSNIARHRKRIHGQS